MAGLPVQAGAKQDLPEHRVTPITITKSYNEDICTLTSVLAYIKRTRDLSGPSIISLVYLVQAPTWPSHALLHQALGVRHLTG